MRHALYSILQFFIITTSREYYAFAYVKLVTVTAVGLESDLGIAIPL
jgi:hypothetical protein